MSTPDDPNATITFSSTDDLRSVRRLAVGLVAFTELHKLALEAATRLRAEGQRIQLSGNRFLNLLSMSCGDRTVTFTRGFGLTDDDVIQVSGIRWTQRLSPASDDEAVAMATRAMERALHFLLSGFDLDAI